MREGDRQVTFKHEQTPKALLPTQQQLQYIPQRHEQTDRRTDRRLAVAIYRALQYCYGKTIRRRLVATDGY